MPPCCVERIVRAPALDARSIRCTRVVFKCIRRTVLNLVVELRECIHVCAPSKKNKREKANDALEKTLLKLENLWDARVRIEDIKCLYQGAMFSQQTVVL